MVQLPGKKANKSGLYGTGLRSQMKINAKEYFGNGVNHTPWARNWTFPVPDDLRRERITCAFPSFSWKSLLIVVCSFLRAAVFNILLAIVADAKKN